MDKHSNVRSLVPEEWESYDWMAALTQEQIRAELRRQNDLKEQENDLAHLDRLERKGIDPSKLTPAELIREVGWKLEITPWENNFAEDGSPHVHVVATDPRGRRQYSQDGKEAEAVKEVCRLVTGIVPEEISTAKTELIANQSSTNAAQVQTQGGISQTTTTVSYPSKAKKLVRSILDAIKGIANFLASIAKILEYLNLRPH